MTRKLVAMVEAERRGLLTGRAREVLLEARKRGLVAEPTDPVARAVQQSAQVNAELMAVLAKAMQAQPKPPVFNVMEREPAPAPRINVQVPASSADHLVGLVFRVVRDRNGYIDYMQIERPE